MTYLIKKWRGFIPLFLIYLLITIFLSKNIYQGDESRYVNFSKNILNGYYANPDLKPGFLWNGPGYPIIIAPFTYFKAPSIYLKLLNSILLFFGVILLYKSLRFKLNHNKSLILSYISGLTHPYFFLSITLILTESLAFFLISLSLYSFIRFSYYKKKKDLLVFSLSSGFLILTKVFFSYVFLLCGIISIFFWTVSRNKKKLSYLVKLSLTPLLICLPYLFYTYSLTGKMFYWSDAGGSALYPMSTPYEGEYGDWFPSKESVGELNKSRTATFKKNTLKENHLGFIKSLSELNGVEKDQRLKEKAIENIKSNKFKFFKNIIYNFGRVSIRYPFTNREIKPLFLLLFTFHFLLLLIPLLVSIKKIIFKLIYPNIIILTFFSIFLIETLILSSDSRFIFPIYPILIYIISTLFSDKKTNEHTSFT